jgi:hypothetical protein
MVRAVVCIVVFIGINLLRVSGQLVEAERREVGSVLNCWWASEQKWTMMTEPCDGPALELVGRVHDESLLEISGNDVAALWS